MSLSWLAHHGSIFSRRESIHMVFWHASHLLPSGFNGAENMGFVSSLISMHFPEVRTDG